MGSLVQFVFIINLRNCTLHLANGQDLYLCSGATDRAWFFCMRMSIVLVQEESLSCSANVIGLNGEGTLPNRISFISFVICEG